MSILGRARLRLSGPGPSLQPAALYRATADTHPDHLVSFRQLTARLFSIPKIDIATFDRGIGNTGAYDRVMPLMLVSRGPDPVSPEPIVRAGR